MINEIYIEKRIDMSVSKSGCEMGFEDRVLLEVETSPEIRFYYFT